MRAQNDVLRWGRGTLIVCNFGQSLVFLESLAGVLSLNIT